MRQRDRIGTLDEKRLTDFVVSPAPPMMCN
jgi:hypothetical protein